MSELLMSSHVIHMEIDRDTALHPKETWLWFYVYYHQQWANQRGEVELKFWMGRMYDRYRAVRHEVTGSTFLNNGRHPIEQHGIDEMGMVSRLFKEWRTRMEFQLRSVTLARNPWPADGAGLWHIMVCKFQHGREQVPEKYARMRAYEVAATIEAELANEFDQVRPRIYHDGRLVTAEDAEADAFASGDILYMAGDWESDTTYCIVLDLMREFQWPSFARSDCTLHMSTRTVHVDARQLRPCRCEGGRHWLEMPLGSQLGDAETAFLNMVSERWGAQTNGRLLSISWPRPRWPGDPAIKHRIEIRLWYPPADGQVSAVAISLNGEAEAQRRCNREQGLRDLRTLALMAQNTLGPTPYYAGYPLWNKD